MRSYVLSVGLLVSSASAFAFGPAGSPHVRPTADAITAMPAAGLSRPLRTVRLVDHGRRATAAWRRFAATGAWQVAWDPATGVPTRIWGSGLPAPGATTDPAVAERIARAVLADHLALLAPGATLADFVLVSNHTDGDTRSIGFTQHASGRRVVGGQLSFRFKRDRLFVIASEALPNVAFAVPRARLAVATLHARATTTLRAELALPTAPVGALGDEVILPLVGDHTVFGYRVATPVTIDGGADGRYLAYLDPATGGVLAVHQQNLYANGTLLYRGVDRHPLRGRVDRPARTAHVTVAGGAQTTGSDGAVTWSPDTPETIGTAVVGDLVEIVNKSVTGTVASAQLAIAPGGQAVWDVSANSEDDAQVVTFLAVNTVKDYVRDNLDAAMPGIADPITANVNIAKSCNAFYDGATINFFAASMTCQNTGVLDDVVFHEFGHALHRAEIIDGVGGFDGSMSEGAADFLAASITGDPGMGRGLFYNEDPLRQLDPPGDEIRWPEDVGEIHSAGRIFGGAFWDLRTALISDLGQVAGVQLVNRLFVAALRRSSSIPTSFVEALAADDDDGNLDNGTPHECTIRAAFGRHGLRFASGRNDTAATLATADPTTPVQFALSGMSTRCTSDTIARALLIWVPNSSDIPVPGTALLAAGAGDTYTANMPLPVDNVMYYSARFEFADGSTLTLADNLADRYYTLYQGVTTPLYCTSFDEDPFAAGWLTGTSNGSESPWAWAAPAGGLTDPPAPFDGERILIQGVGGDYPRNLTTYAQLPPIDIGQWSDVHLQYRRWLAVEDGEFDKARITVDGQLAWTNGSQNRGDASSFDHIDREWRFHDVRVSGLTQGHEINVAFELAADGGTQFGGWAIDELCVVANVNSVCGDRVVSATEGCDDGTANANLPNACRTYCRKPTCGDLIVDDMEECDEGTGGNAYCTPSCKSLVVDDGGGGCCSASGGPAGTLLLSGFTAAVLLGWRRRRVVARSTARRRR